MHRSWTDIFKRPARVFACTLAMSLFLTGAFSVQQVAYEEKSRAAAAAAERLQLLEQQDYELRFHAADTLAGGDLTRREALERNAMQIRATESSLLRSSAEMERLAGMSLLWSFALTGSYLSGLLLAACLLLMGASRLIGRQAVFGREYLSAD